MEEVADLHVHQAVGFDGGFQKTTAYVTRLIRIISISMARVALLVGLVELEGLARGCACHRRQRRWGGRSWVDFRLRLDKLLR